MCHSVRKLYQKHIFFANAHYITKEYASDIAELKLDFELRDAIWTLSVKTVNLVHIISAKISYAY